jgi:hypothetical protein
MGIAEVLEAMTTSAGTWDEMDASTWLFTSIRSGTTSATYQTPTSALSSESAGLRLSRMAAPADAGMRPSAVKVSASSWRCWTRSLDSSGVASTRAHSMPWAASVCAIPPPM